ELLLRADLAFIAIGFCGVREEGVPGELGEGLATSIDARGSVNIAADEVGYRTSLDRLYAAGDARRGQSLRVWGIRECGQPAHASVKGLAAAPWLPGLPARPSRTQARLEPPRQGQRQRGLMLAISAVHCFARELESCFVAEFEGHGAAKIDAVGPFAA